jgi:hypothetical protein
MTKTAERVYLLGPAPPARFRFHRPVARPRGRCQIHEAILTASRQSSLWIATGSKPTDDLLRAALATGSSWNGRPRLGRLLMLFPPRLDSLPALHELFEPVAWGTAAFRILPYDELAEVLDAENRRDLFIGGFVDPGTATLILYRGDLERLAVPLSQFKSFGSGPQPNAAGLAFTDHGQTVCLGDYQAAADAILYEVAPDYRRRILAKRHEEDRSFGACLRRLRVLRGLRQGDFNAIPARTIARIERGEVARPHRDTLQRIAKHLDVEPADIETF